MIFFGSAVVDMTNWANGSKAQEVAESIPEMISRTLKVRPSVLQIETI